VLRPLMGGQRLLSREARRAGRALKASSRSGQLCLLDRAVERHILNNHGLYKRSPLGGETDDKRSPCFSICLRRAKLGQSGRVETRQELKITENKPCPRKLLLLGARPDREQRGDMGRGKPQEGGQEEEPALTDQTLQARAAQGLPDMSIACEFLRADPACEFLRAWT